MNSRHDTFGENTRTGLEISARYREKIIRDRTGKKIEANPAETDLIRNIKTVQEKIYLLTLKVTEEMIELQGAIAENIQENIHTESSDVLEVLDSLQKIMPESIEIRSGRREFIEWLMAQGFDMPSIINAQEEKRRKLGSFDQGYVLKI